MVLEPGRTPCSMWAAFSHLRLTARHSGWTPFSMYLRPIAVVVEAVRLDGQPGPVAIGIAVIERRARDRAASDERVKARFPQLEVFETTPPATQSISSAAEFERFLELIQGQLRNGTLRQRMAGTPDVPPVDVLRVPLRGPWPDVIEADFIDARGQPYRLFVDGYHGTGVWQELTSSGERDELPDWEFEIREVSAGVYRATGTDRVGHRVVIEGVDPDACLEECRSSARTFLGGK